MKQVYFTIALLLTSVSICSGQSYIEKQRVQVITHHIVIPENGTLDEALSLSQEWTEKVLKKNPNFDEIELFVSETKADTIKLMVLYRYSDEITRDTNEINQELISQGWPGEGEFDSFIGKLRKYINPALNEMHVFQALGLKDDD